MNKAHLSFGWGGFFSIDIKMITVLDYFFTLSLWGCIIAFLIILDKIKPWDHE
jgi:hypothetical protein